MICSISEAYHLPPSSIRKWPASDVFLLQRYWQHQQLAREEANAPDSPAKMRALAGSM